MSNDQSQSLRAVKDCLAGTAAGIAQVLSGQPFDTVKVRLQTAAHSQYTGTLDCALKLYRSDGLLGFYKGTLTPLLGIGACVSIQFATNEYMKRFFAANNNGAPMRPSQFYLAGMAAGLANAALASPIEHVRIRLQTQSTFSGPLDCIRKIYSAYGLKGIFRGFFPTAIRESLGAGAYFFTYESLVARELKKGKRRADISSIKLCLFGASAGYAFWLSCYPIDVVKSKLQTDSLVKADQRYKSSIGCFRHIIQIHGVPGLFRGLTPTLLRAAPVSAATFMAFEAAMRVLA
ncbi:putative mitochondrial carrier [Neolecta irregularis DAH-3]|uniref:Putative mitochondrial carrier n=1 Tax=Neolecta irregularis (strain DAH-3) TaxID=1198029 RepID=A0A1U7LWT1_NEOID|nr:putative mitochondrial carrier [Neolecta irregularis DAH-3]|eukprot:OLL27094.1 putative mitochondrial carrier [Neolecta irregularis DAH-3]